MSNSLPIDLSTEHTFDISRAIHGGFFPHGRGSERVHRATVIRWILTGVRGPDGGRVHLRAIRCGSRWITSSEAIAEFLAALNQRADAPTAPPIRTPGQRRRASERAAKELDKLGV